MTTRKPMPSNLPRRRDRTVEDESWIRAVLTAAPFGVLAIAGKDGPSVNSNLFVFDSSRDAIYFHTARRGATRSAVENEPRTVFTVSEMGRVLPSTEAIHFSAEYISVVTQGSTRIVDDPQESINSLGLLMRKYAPHLEPGRDYRGVEAKDVAKTTVYRMDIDSWSGKRNIRDGAEGAFEYPDPALRSLIPATGDGGQTE